MSRAAAPASVATSRHGWMQWGLPLVLTALAYFATGLAALKLAIPPALASPLYPAAGIALASVLVFGWRMLAGVALGSLAVNLAVHASRGFHDPAVVAVPLILALAAALQAGAGAALVRRFVRQPLTLTLPRDVAAFLACCAASSVVSPSISTLALRASAVIAPANGLVTWATWWLGDLAGLLIATPIVLTLIGRPRSEWAPRRLPVGLTMTLVVAFLGLGIVQASRWSSERLRASFAHDASGASLILATQLEEPLRALEAMRGVFTVVRHMPRADMRLATQRWLDSGAVSAMGWSERVRREDIPAFETRVRADGANGYRVFDRTDAVAPLEGPAGTAGSAPTRADSGEVIVVRLIEPLQGNAAALGVNSLSIPAARAAIQQTVDTGNAAATAGFRLTQQEAADKRMGIVIYQAIYDGEMAGIAQRRAALRGVVFVTLTMDTLLAGVVGQVPAYLQLCVVDADPLATRWRLSGSPGCETDSTGLMHERPVVFAGRQWEVRVSADPGSVPGSADRSVFTIAAVGLLSAAMLGASLLITTGRTRRIESAVRERTAALRAEVSERQAAETARRASEQRFRNILDNVPIGVVYTDLAGRVIQANPR